MFLVRNSYNDDKNNIFSFNPIFHCSCLKSVRTLSPKPPYVVLKTEPKKSKIEDQFKYLFNEQNVRVFLVSTESDVRTLKKVRYVEYLYLETDEKNWTGSKFGC